jgi:predicted ATP-dependent endonuclease of OLD family
MELLFLWIEDFRNIKQQGFNFSAAMNFEVIPALEQKDSFAYKITVRLNDDYANIFDGNIVNVTGVVGRNGSGKSSLLHCLKVMCGKLSILTSPLIFSLFDRESKTIKTYYYKEGGRDMQSLSVTVEGDELLEKRFKIEAAIPYSINQLAVYGSRLKGLDFDFSDIACCFYSNAFDSHRENIYEGIHNISTNYRVELFLKRYIEEKVTDVKKKVNKEAPKLEVWPSHIYEYHKSEIRTLLKFLSYAKTRKTGTIPKLPEFLIVEFNFDDFEYLRTEKRNYFLFEPTTIEEIQKLAVKLISQSKNKRDNFLNLVVLSAFYHVVRKDFFKKTASIDNIKQQIKELPNSQDRLFDNIRKLLLPLEQTGEFTESKEINEFLGEKFSKAVSKIEFQDYPEAASNRAHFRLMIDNNIWPVLNLITDLRSLNDSTFIDYSWGGGLSTGQEAFLSHFARLFELKDHLRNKTIWLLVDEGDLYFHPQWQKSYFSNLLEYVTFLFPRNKVQIIITTHSPFIASDLPKQNLIFLRQNEDGKCEVNKSSEKKETFGSNIHELFTNSFFLEDGLMGEFARSKIEILIKEVSEKTTVTAEEYETSFKNRIGIIGEPFIQTKLIELVASKSNAPLLDNIISLRNNELEYLQKLRKKKKE